MPVNFDKIRELRDAAGLTQSQAAARAHELNPKSFNGPNAKIRWADIERGRFKDPQISTLELVAQVVGCQARDLLTDVPPARPQSRRRRPSAAAGSKG
jgi:transcriptional regulator with XRE-family HTH domain